MPAAGPPMPERSSSAGRLERAAGDDDVGRLHRDAAGLPGGRVGVRRGDAGGAALLGADLVGLRAGHDHGAGVEGVAQVGVEGAALAAARVAELGVAGGGRVVGLGVDVADRGVHRPAERLRALGHPLVRAVVVRAVGVGAHPREDGLEVAVELGGVEPVEAVLLRPLAAHLVAGLDAVVPVDRRAAAEGGAGEQPDVAVGRDRQARPVHHLLARLDLELAVVALAGRLARLQDDDLLALRREDAGDRAAAGAGAHDDDVGLEHLAVVRDVAGDVRLVLRRRDDRAGVAVLRPRTGCGRSRPGSSGRAGTRRRAASRPRRAPRGRGPSACRACPRGWTRPWCWNPSIARPSSSWAMPAWSTSVSSLRNCSRPTSAPTAEPGVAQKPCGSSPSGAGSAGTAVSTRALSTSRWTGVSSATAGFLLRVRAAGACPSPRTLHGACELGKTPFRCDLCHPPAHARKTASNTCTSGGSSSSSGGCGSASSQADSSSLTAPTRASASGRKGCARTTPASTSRRVSVRDDAGEGVDDPAAVRAEARADADDLEQDDAGPARVGPERASGRPTARPAPARRPSAAPRLLGGPDRGDGLQHQPVVELGEQLLAAGPQLVEVAGRDAGRGAEPGERGAGPADRAELLERGVEQPGPPGLAALLRRLPAPGAAARSSSARSTARSSRARRQPGRAVAGDRGLAPPAVADADQPERDAAAAHRRSTSPARRRCRSRRSTSEDDERERPQRRAGGDDGDVVGLPPGRVGAPRDAAAGEDRHGPQVSRAGPVGRSAACRTGRLGP